MLTVGNYHYIRENFKSKYPSIFGVQPAQFKKQLALLRNQGDFMAPDQLIFDIDAVLKSKENLILITFDDGLKEQFDLALPILDEQEIPAIFFANSLNSESKQITVVHKIHLLRSVVAPETLIERIESVNPITLTESEKQRSKDIYRFDDSKSAMLKYLLNFKISFAVQEIIINQIFEEFFDEQSIFQDLYMNDDQLIFLANNGYLGSHTHSHLPIGLLDETAMRFELEHSKSYFETLTNSKIEMVSYPYGTEESATQKVSEMAREVGYKAGFTTKKGSNTSAENQLLLHRFDCNDLIGGKNYKQ